MAELTRDQLLMAVISGRGPAYLRGVDLSSIDLSSAGWLAGADLQQTNLSHTILSRSNLSLANLERANLQGANLAGANLENANMERARLNVANLMQANLRNANLRGARLVGANLMRASLEGADLEGADLEGASLEGADLYRARLDMANLRFVNIHQALNVERASLRGTTLEERAEAADISLPDQGFSGAVGAVQLTDVVQLLCLSKASCIMRVESPDGTGMIHIRTGKVYHAQCGTLTGEDAFVEILRWEKGRFETLPLSEESSPSIEKPLEHLLIQSMRQKDEGWWLQRSEKNAAIIQDLKNHLPIPAYPSPDLIEAMSSEGRSIEPTARFQITDVFDSGDSTGILCSVVAEDAAVFIAPLRSLRIEGGHPLATLIEAYQEGYQRDSNTIAVFS